MSSPRKIVIVGGGITGLAAAYYVQKTAREKGLAIQLTLVESDNRLGGKVVTHRANDFVIEGGPDSFVTDKPWALQLAHELGLADELIPSSEDRKKIYVLRNGRLVEFPGGMRLTIPTQVVPFLKTRMISWPGKLRMGLDLVIPARKEDTDESLAQFIRRRLGAEALDRFAAPLMAGIFVADAEKLSMKATFPTFLAMEKNHRSLVLAAQHAKRHPPQRKEGAIRPAGGAMFNSFRGGMTVFTDELAGRIEGDVRLGTRIVSIARSGAGYMVELDGDKPGRVEADAVLLTAPAYTCADLLEPLHQQLPEQLRQIRYVSTATISFTYLESDIPSSRPLDGFGVMIPGSEKRKILASTWSSTKFRHRAPPGTALMRAFVGGHRDESAPSRPDDELVALVRREYEELFGITAAPMATHIFRWLRGNPQYDVGHLDRIAEIERSTGELPGIFLAGSAFRGIGLPDCIRSAQQTALKMVG